MRPDVWRSRILVLAPDESGALSFKRTRLSLDAVRIVRARGPRDDGLPRRLRLDGQLRMDAVQGLSFATFACRPTVGDSPATWG